MDRKNKWHFEEFGSRLDRLEPGVRDRAVEIAYKLMENSGLSKAGAIEEGIELAEELFYDLEG